MQRIDSDENKKLKRLTSLKQKKVRVKEGLFLIEGVKVVNEALGSYEGMDLILISDSFLQKNKEYVLKLEKSAIEIFIARDGLFNKCSSLATPQGILAQLKIRKENLEDILLDKNIVMLDGLKDPGNLGTIVRTADAFGFGGVLLLPDCAEIYNPKTVQAAMGSILRVPCLNVGYDSFDILKKAGYPVYGMDPKGEDMVDATLAGKAVVVIGSESHGLSRETVERCDRLISISMSGAAESLNAAVAAGIIMNRLS
ncbi:MAG: RNA methyltransferase [Clostridia bacterium]|nr:RNA methyltransferase [Clostridia bacterium]